ncbi:MAG: hypothetical protein ACRENB_06565 [Gemmatimonadales bacterium]
MLAAGAYLIRAQLDQSVPVPGILRYVLLFAGFTMVALAVLVRSRIVPRSPPEDAGAWWRVNLPRAIVVWALLDTTAALGAASHLLTGDLFGYGVLVAASLAALAIYTPARLAGD